MQKSKTSSFCHSERSEESRGINSFEILPSTLRCDAASWQTVRTEALAEAGRRWLRKTIQVFATSLLIIFLAPLPALAGTLTVIQNLSFGTMGMHNNSGVYSITVRPDNTFSHNPNIVFGVDPQRGEYFLTGMPPNDPIDITISSPGDAVPDLGGSDDFTSGSYTFSPPNGSFTSDGSGQGTLFVGATLKTSGTGDYYHTGHYTGSFDVTVVF